MADWLNSTINYLNELPAHETVRDVLWVVPATQTVHILCVSVVFAGSMAIALRALGLAGTYWTLDRWQRRLGVWTGVSLLLLLLTGCVLILAEPPRALSNQLFQIKVPMVVAATLLSFGIGRRFSAADRVRTSFGLKLGAIVVLLMWLVIIGLGRWIAYAG